MRVWRKGLEKIKEGDVEQLRGDCFEDVVSGMETRDGAGAGRLTMEIEESAGERVKEVELNAAPSAAESAAEDTTHSTSESASETSDEEEEEEDDDDDDDVIEIEEAAFRKLDLLSAA